MLYFVATPIGNLKEITLRALEVLKEADEIYCEDTRHSLILLNHYDIKKPLIPYQKFNEREKSEEIIGKLKNGKIIAVISDAGMPLISDPGGVLAARLKSEGLKYSVVSGACALINALVLSGMDTSAFYMCGFLPPKSGQKNKRLTYLKDITDTLIFYSAPHDVKKDLGSLYSVFGDREVSLVREISKKFEEAVNFKLGEEADFTEKGEMVIVVKGKSKEAAPVLESEIEELIQKYLGEGLSKKDAAAKAAEKTGVKKSRAYEISLKF